MQIYFDVRKYSFLNQLRVQHPKIEVFCNTLVCYTCIYSIWRRRSPRFPTTISNFCSSKSLQDLEQDVVRSLCFKIYTWIKESNFTLDWLFTNLTGPLISVDDAYKTFIEPALLYKVFLINVYLMGGYILLLLVITILICRRAIISNLPYTWYSTRLLADHILPLSVTYHTCGTPYVCWRTILSLSVTYHARGTPHVCWLIIFWHYQ